MAPSWQTVMGTLAAEEPHIFPQELVKTKQTECEKSEYWVYVGLVDTNMPPNKRSWCSVSAGLAVNRELLSPQLLPIALKGQIICNGRF